MSPFDSRFVRAITRVRPGLARALTASFTALLVGIGCGRIDFERLDRAADGGAVLDGAVLDGAVLDGALATDAGGADGGDDAGAPAAFENVRLTNADGRASGAAIATHGGVSCVTWSDASSGASQVWAGLFDRSFSPLGTPVRLTDTSTASEAAVPVHNGAGWGIVWLEVGSGSATVHGAELDDAGSVVTSARALTAATSVGGNVTVAFGGGRYHVGWADSRWGGAEVVVATVEVGMTAFGETRLTTAAGASYFPWVTWTGSDLGVAWADDRSGDAEIYFTRLAGTTPSPETRVTTSEGLSLLPSVGFDGAGFLLVWNDASSGVDEIRLATLDAAGTPSGERRISGDAPTIYPVLAVTPSGSGAVWSDDRDAVRRIYGAGVSRETTRPAVPISDPTGVAFAPWIAADDDAFVVVWEDSRHGEGEIYGARGRL